MIEGRLPQGALLKKIFEAVKEMITDVNLECSEGGISLQAMDASHVALVTVDILHGGFDHYKCTQESTLGLNMVQVNKIFRLCGSNDQVILRHDNEENSDKLTFIFESKLEDKISHFDLRLMNFESDHLGIPKTEFAANVMMPSKYFAKVITDLGNFSDTLQIQVNSKGIKISAKGEFGSGSTLYKATDIDKIQNSDIQKEDVVRIECEGEVDLIFATRYLQYFTRAASLADTMVLSMSPNQPLQVLFELQNDPAIGLMKFFLAPKMDDNMM